MDKLVSVFYSIDSHKLVLVVTRGDKTRVYSRVRSYRQFSRIVALLESYTAAIKLSYNSFSSVLSFEAIL